VHPCKPTAVSDGTDREREKQLMRFLFEQSFAAFLAAPNTPCALHSESNETWISSSSALGLAQNAHTNLCASITDDPNAITARMISGDANTTLWCDFCQFGPVCPVRKGRELTRDSGAVCYARLGSSPIRCGSKVTSLMTS
jgi:hypothetical protein